MKTLRVRRALTDEEAAGLAGKLLGPSSFDVLVSEDCDVLREDGTPLLLYRAGVFRLTDCVAAHRGLRDAARVTRNRGTAAGEAALTHEERVNWRAGAGVEGDLRPKVPLSVRTRTTRYRPVKRDGTLSNTDYAPPVESGIVGYYDRTARTPYCRLTAYTMEHAEKFAAALPLLRRASATFRELCPERWEAQRAVVAATSGDFVIPGTVFTTVTVNRNWQTAVHKDAGDLREGYGVMAALRAGVFDGGYLCFPQFRVAVDMRTRGLLLADVHEWHGNTPLVGRSEGWERVSLVMYYRDKMRHCGTAAEELRRAQGRRRGDPMND